MATVIVSARRVMRFLEGGGHFWVYLQYVRGLQLLGCDVYWLERFRSSGDPARDAAALATFTARMARLGLADHLLLYTGPEAGQTPAPAPAHRHHEHSDAHSDEAGSEAGWDAATPDDTAPFTFLGRSRSQAEALLQHADLLLNFDYTLAPALLARCRRSVLVDIDPGLLQFWIATQQLQVPPHDLYLTTGETVGLPTARFPDGGRVWHHIHPPVALEAWPYHYTPHAASFTTVSSWWSGDWFEYGTERYDNNKRASFLEFVDLPRHTPQPLELALWFGDKKAPERLYADGDERDHRLLEQHGWRVRHSREVAATPERYHAYVQGSRGEFSCAKRSYIRLETAWVSDRTLCYLASGKPVVVQHTGASAFLPNGAGMFRFTTLADAVEAFATINRAYAYHCQAARAVAETYFDAKQILSTMLNMAL